MFRRFFVFVVCLLFFTVLSDHVSAKSLSFTVPVTSLKGEQEFTVTATASGFTPAEQIYIKGAFYKEGSSNYFGYTKASDNWVKNSAKTTEQRKVAFDTWDGSLMVKPDYTDSGFTDNGHYFFKVGFYSIGSDGEPSSVQWSDNSVAIQLEKPIPTATPVPSSTPAPTPTKTPTPQPTNVPTQTPTQKPSATPTKRVSPTATLIPTDEPQTDVLGETDELPALTPTPSDVQKQSAPLQSRNKNLAVSFAFVACGLGILSLFTLYQQIKKQRNKERGIL